MDDIGAIEATRNVASIQPDHERERAITESPATRGRGDSDENDKHGGQQ